MEQALIRISEAAKLLGRHPQTLRRWDNQEPIKSALVKIGKQRRYKLARIKEIRGEE